ncbi:hypothetical protein M408DRAFT_325486 [Serendipita vermifera MAFF 305830]|uniref:Cupredoxin n=1 Tax=Serendipita vermifera MAFF 305830 TaxID=933852 RepID=A0A0C3BR34_SERVB|nr:hypothetical protein M408DRAFT_325486 [Serendipita vermifera MAFF 305830]
MRPVSILVPLLTFVCSVAAADYQVIVGGPDGVFVPNGVMAEENDTVTFTFVNGTHSVIQSNFVFPCEAINVHEPTANGFNSGPRPTNNGTAITNLTVPVTRAMLNVTTWWYDGSEHQCGWDETAVGGINLREESNETLAGYQRNAARLFGEESLNPPATSTTTRRSSTAGPSATGGGGSNGATYGIVANQMAMPAAFLVAALSVTLF